MTTKIKDETEAKRFAAAMRKMGHTVTIEKVSDGYIINWSRKQ